MRERVARSRENRIDYSKFANHSNPVLDPVQGDVLRDDACTQPPMTRADLARAEENRRLRFEQLLAKKR